LLAGLFSLGILGLIATCVVRDALMSAERSRAAAIARVEEMRDQAQQAGQPSTVQALDKAIAEFRRA
jgi:hypothetical protein